MAVGQDYVAQVERKIAESVDGSLDLSEHPFLDIETTRHILKMIAEQMPAIKSLDVDFGTNLSDAKDGLLAAFVEESQRLQLEDETALITRLRYLGLVGPEITNNRLNALTESALAGQLPLLDELNLFGASVTDESVTRWADAASAGQLPQLSLLQLSWTQVTDASVTRWAEAALAGRLPQLSGLDLAATLVTDASVTLWAEAALAGQLPQLSSLQLSWTEVTDASVTRWAEAALAGRLPQLQYIDLSKTQVTDASITRWAEAFSEGHLPRLTLLELHGTGVTVQPSVLDSLNARTILQWYCDRAAAPALLPEAKLLIVGQGEVGKSVLCRRLFAGDEETAPPDRKLTHDFDMHEYQLPASLLTGDEFSELKLRVWDFGGQEFLHGSHRFFVGAERAFYLLVLDASKNSRANQLTYWLRFLAQHGTQKSGETSLRAPVLIVLTQSDKLLSAQEGKHRTTGEELRNYGELLRALRAARRQGYFGAKVIGLIAGLGLPDADEAEALSDPVRLRYRHHRACARIRQSIAEHLDQIIFLRDTVALGDRQIRDWVLAHFMPQAGKTPLPRFRWDQDPFRSWALEQSLDREGEKPPNEELLERRVTTSLRILKSLGLVHWVGDNIQQTNDPLSNMVFNPWWVKTPVYRVLGAKGVKNSNGWVSPQDLNQILAIRAATKFSEPVTAKNVRDWFDSLPFTTDDRETIRELLVRSGLLFEVHYGPRKKGWLIPDLLRPQTKPEPDKLPTADVLTFQHSFDFLPDRVLLRFLAKVLIEAYQSPERLDATRREQLHRELYRNAACLPWHIPGHDAPLEVRLRTEINPPLAERPWLSITVSGGDQDLRCLVLNEVIRELNTVLDSEGLGDARMPPVLIASKREATITQPLQHHKTDADLVETIPSGPTAGSPPFPTLNESPGSFIPAVVDAAPDSRMMAEKWSTLPQISERAAQFGTKYGVPAENFLKPIPTVGMDEVAKKWMQLFLKIGREFQKTGSSRCTSLAEVSQALAIKAKQDKAEQFQFPGIEKSVTCRNLVYECRRVMDAFFARHFGLTPPADKSESRLFDQKGKPFTNLSPLGWHAMDLVEQLLNASDA